jgi:hypothetical protein
MAVAAEATALHDPEVVGAFFVPKEANTVDA